MATQYDWLFWTLALVCGAVTICIAVFVIYPALVTTGVTRTNCRSRSLASFDWNYGGSPSPYSFLWASSPGEPNYFDIERLPRNATQVYVIATMDVEIPISDGRREINELHVPVVSPLNW